MWMFYTPLKTELVRERLQKKITISHDQIGDKIKLLEGEGKPHDQAVAIALSMAGEGRSNTKKGFPRTQDGKYATTGNDSGIDYKGIGSLDLSDLLADPGDNLRAGLPNSRLAGTSFEATPAAVTRTHEASTNQQPVVRASLVVQ